MSLSVTPTAAGATLKVRVAPGAKRERLVGVYGDAVKVSVRAPPERGRANEAVVALLAEALGVPRGAVAIARGGAARDKVVLVRGWDAARLRARLEELLPG